MAAKKKVYTVYTHSRSGEALHKTGTVEELREYYSYTLEVGWEYNRKINRFPKSIKALVSNYNKAVDEKYGSCYYRSYMHLVEENNG